ncbi:DUF4279 domain-containing protein [Nocardia thailandica]|uniref:DUF4279 domain-containing protein n=1 Tax=Nocardia thailandica TaxID=257275 RepID=A0ABW6PFW8_9NOCA
MTVADNVEVSVSLRLTGTFDPDEVTASLGLVPTDQWRSGQAGPAPRLRRPSDGWVRQLNKGFGEVAPHIDQAARQLAKISTQLQQVVALPGVSGYLGIAVDSPADHWPEITLSAPTLALIAASGLSLDIDVV